MCNKIGCTTIKHIASKAGVLTQTVSRVIDERPREGFPEEWQMHPQGRLAGYLPREIIANPDSTTLVQAGQVFGWNISLTGVKSEDTILIKEHDNDVLTGVQGWPMLEVHLNGQTFLRLTCLERR